jgi:hypothetical protein
MKVDELARYAYGLIEGDDVVEETIKLLREMKYIDEEWIENEE